MGRCSGINILPGSGVHCAQPTRMELAFLPFDASHYDEYRSWYVHPAVRKALSSIDQDWLEHILNDDSGREYAIFLGEEFVAEVGIVFPIAQDAPFAITNIAVNPDWQRRGVGSVVLWQLAQTVGAHNWLAYVASDNLNAQAFFRKNGWKAHLPPYSEGMIAHTAHYDFLTLNSG